MAAANGSTNFVDPAEGPVEPDDFEVPSHPPLVFEVKIAVAILVCTILTMGTTFAPLTWVSKHGDTFRYRVDLSKVTVEKASESLPDQMADFRSETWKITEFKEHACNDERAKLPVGFYHEACLMWEHMRKDVKLVFAAGAVSIALYCIAAAMYVGLSFKPLPRFLCYILLLVQLSIPCINGVCLALYRTATGDFKRYWPLEGDRTMGWGFYLAWVATLASGVPALLMCRLVMLDVIEEDVEQTNRGGEGGWEPPVAPPWAPQQQGAAGDTSNYGGGPAAGGWAQPQGNTSFADTTAMPTAPPRASGYGVLPMPADPVAMPEAPQASAYGDTMAMPTAPARMSAYGDTTAMPTGPSRVSAYGESMAMPPPPARASVQDDPALSGGDWAAMPAPPPAIG